MDINDYNSKLSDVRQKYREATNETKNNYAKREENLAKLHKHAEKGQRENYMRDKLRMEEESAIMADGFKKRTKKELDRRAVTFNKRSEAQRKDFHRARKTQDRNFKQRLNSIKDSYDNSLKDTTRSNKIVRDGSRKSFDKKLNSLNKNFQDSVAQLQKKSNDQFDKHRIDSDIENKETLHRHRMEKQDLVQKASVSNNRLKSAHQNETELIRDAQQNELRNLKNHHQEGVVKKSDNQQDATENLKKNFLKISQSNANNNKKDAIKLARDNVQVTQNRMEQAGKDRLLLQRKIDAILDSGITEKHEKKLVRVVDAYERKIKGQNDSIEVIAYKNQQAQRRLGKGHQAALFTQSIAHNRDVDDLLLENRHLRTEVISELKEGQQKQIEHYKKEILNTDLKREQSSLDGQQQLKGMLERQRMDYSRQMRSMAERNVRALNDLQKEVAHEKTRYIITQRKDNFVKREQMRNSMILSYEGKEKNLVDQLDAHIRENQSLKKRYEHKIVKLKNFSAKQLKDYKLAEEDRRSEELRGFRQSLSDKELDNVRSIARIRDNFNLKLLKSKKSAEIFQNKLTERYEKQLKLERSDSRKEMTRRLNEVQTNYNRLVKTSKMEKETTEQKYRLKMEKLKQANIDAQERARISAEAAGSGSSESQS